MKLKSYIESKANKVWNFAITNYAFYKRHNLVYKNGDIERIKLSSSEKKEYRDYWKSISPNISFRTVEITKSLTGKFNKKIVPEEFYALYIEPKINNDKSAAFQENKSLYNKFFNDTYFPKDYFHKINDIYYTHDLQVIKDINDFISNQIGNVHFPVVAKPNRDSYGGKDIFFLKNKTEILNTIEEHANLVIQEKIVQSELINVFNKDSINTIRVCLYKDKQGNTHILNSAIRMGKDGSLDNETAGGIVCNIKSSGMLNEYAVDKYAVKYFSHPNSEFSFKGKVLPLYDDLRQVSIEIANKLIGVRIISLDMALDADNKWRCIELNLFGQTIRFAQYAGEPFFGDFTDEIIRDVSNL